MFRAYRVFSLLQPRRPRHPLLQGLLAVVVCCAFVALLAFGAVVGLIAMFVALIARALGFSRPFGFAGGVKPQSTPSTDSRRDSDGIIDGEFRVVDKSMPHGPHA